MKTSKEHSAPADLAGMVPGEGAAVAAAFQAGDRAVFDQVVRDYKDRVYNVIYRLVGNHEDALDLAQETFIRAWRGADKFQGHAQVYTWLYSIAANLAKNRLRDRGRKGRNQGRSLEALHEAAPGALPAAAEVNPRDAASASELRDALDVCLEALPDIYRLAFVLRTFDGLSYDDIAQAAGCPRGTIKSRLNQARKRLHECLSGRGVI